MNEYLKRSYKKLQEDLLPKAVYDLLKMIFITILGYIILKYSPKYISFIGYVNSELTLKIVDIVLIVIVAVIITIFVCTVLNRKKLASIRHDLLTDELTGIANHKALSNDLPKAIEWAKHSKKPFCIILMDIDNFKMINTNYSLKVADEILTKFGTLLRNDNRLTDKTYRQHAKGDEFVIITKETILENAVKAANRKREIIAQTGIVIRELDTPINITVCCGVVEFNSASDDSQSLLNRAFEAMKRAKSAVDKNTTIPLV